ncbi:MAG: phospholipase D-like domain-containing protein [Pseudomonadota bacterium]
MKRVLQVPRNAFVEAQAEQSALLIDARNYYATLYRALEQAENYVVISGWQFESGVRLLRGEDSERTRYPVGLLDFLGALCTERPKLRIYILAWDFSVVYAKDREFQQAEKFNAKHPQLRFQWDVHPSVGGSHHQKFVAVDGAVGFIGGIDLCDARWDDCDHRIHHPDRVNVVGDPCKPYHDVQACFAGQLVASLVDLFVERWQRASAERLQLPAADSETRSRYDLVRLSEGCAEHIGATCAALSRTQVDTRAEPARVGEVLALFADAIAAARQLIYAETQYFTSRSVAQILIERMRDCALPKLEIVVFLPHGADSALEKLALEDTQEEVLSRLLEAAAETGHELRLLYPASRNADGTEIATFIHSKILVVDDRFLMIGSPNFTERSVALDSELAISWECASEQDGLSDCIRNVRSKLLAEHSGLPAHEWTMQEGLCARIDGLVERADTRLRYREVIEAGPFGPLLAQIFDPGDAALTDAALADPAHNP